MSIPGPSTRVLYGRRAGGQFISDNTLGRRKKEGRGADRSLPLLLDAREEACDAVAAVAGGLGG